MLNSCESSRSAYARVAALPARLEQNFSLLFLFTTLTSAGRSYSRPKLEGLDKRTCHPLRQISIHRERNGRLYQSYHLRWIQP